MILEDVCSISSRVWGKTHQRTLEHQGVLWGVFRLFFHSLLMKVFSRQRKLLRAGQLEMKTRAFAVWRWKANRRRQLAEDSRLLVEMIAEQYRERHADSWDAMTEAEREKATRVHELDC